jgi:two-component system response regulator
MMQLPYTLLVEDNQDDADLTLRALKKQGFSHEVVVARNGAEALDYLFGRGQYQDRDVQQVPELVLLDINMPLVNGFEVLKAMRQHEVTKAVPVVMLSSSNEPCDVSESYVLGANKYLHKEANLVAFTEAMGEVVRQWEVVR